MTREEFYKNLDLLVLMSGVKVNNIDSLNADLDDIKVELSALKKERKNLKAEMTDERYFDATSEIVDRNLVISLKKRINKLNIKIKDLEEELETLIKAEEAKHLELIDLEATICDDEQFVLSLTNRINSIKDNEDQSSLNDYQESLNITSNILNNNKTLYNELTKAYEKIVNELNEKTLLSEKLNNELDESKNKLDITNKALDCKETYIDQELKNSDLKKLDDLDAKIKLLDDRKLDIITNPVYIVNEIKDFIETDDMISAMNKTKELITDVERIPYIEEDDIHKLEELRTSLEQEKDDFIEYTDSKKYDEVNLEPITDRILYLNSLINVYNEEITFICKQISKLDVSASVINSNIKKALEQRELITTDITLYNNIIISEEHMPVRRRNAITSVLNKKEEQLKILNKIITTYRVEQNESLAKIEQLEKEELDTLKNRISDIEQEKDNLTKVMNSLKSKNKDILAEESDKEILRQFDERLTALDNRLNQANSLSEIKANIDIYFGNQASINESIEEDTGIIFTPVEDKVNYEDSFENKFLDIPESNLISIDEILNEDEELLPPIDNTEEETIDLFSNNIENELNNDDDLIFESATSFDLPKFTIETPDIDPSLIEVIDVSSIIVDDNKGE